ncbi:hypothetical protein BDE02_06G238600 [Populus trichocarpa]|nr:hypothetical protein BDE02_06G238600 [Populus trichocarpa]
MILVSLIAFQAISANHVITGWLDLDFDRFHLPLNLCSWDLQLIQVWSLATS